MGLLELLLQTLAPGGRLADTHGACLPGLPGSRLPKDAPAGHDVSMGPDVLSCWILFSRTGKNGALFGSFFPLFSHPLHAKGLFSAEYIGTWQHGAATGFLFGNKISVRQFPTFAACYPLLPFPLTTPSNSFPFRAILTSPGTYLIYYLTLPT